MKILKRILLVIVGIIALLLIVALFIPREYRIERDVLINRPDTVVFDYVKHIRNQDNYSVWNKADPNMHQEAAGTDGTVGFINRWSGNKDVGVGEQEITKIEENKCIDTALRFKEPMESEFGAYMITEAEGAESTKVTWGIAGKSAWPLNIMNPMMDGMMGDDLQQNLNNLKALLEK